MNKSQGLFFVTDKMGLTMYVCECASHPETNALLRVEKNKIQESINAPANQNLTRKALVEPSIKSTYFPESLSGNH